MFVDGVTYSAISKNLAHGIGTYFQPHYTKVLYPSFYEHPPLVFIIQSYFFRIFGDAYYTERIYSFLTAITAAICISKCWRLFSRGEDRNYYWLPIILWIMVPVVSWSYRNNMLENTMSVFTLMSFYCISKALIDKRSIYILYGALYILLAVLSKGVVGLFPIITPLLYIAIYDKSKVIKLHFIYLVIALLFLSSLLLLITPELISTLKLYFNNQLLPSILGNREITTNSRFHIIFSLMTELGISIGILIIVWIFNWRRKIQFELFRNKAALLFFLLAIFSSIPLVISLKQRIYYLVPSIPFYILFISIAILPYIRLRIEHLSTRTLVLIRGVLILLVASMVFLFYTRYGTFSRDEDKLTDVYTLVRLIPEGAIISGTKKECMDWGLIAYLSRVANVSLDCDSMHKYFLVDKRDELPNDFHNKYIKMETALNGYLLFKRNN